MAEQYDLIVIGAGPGGYPAAIAAAKSGLRVAVAESRELGGTCLNRGCIPTKTLLHSSELYRELMHGGEIGLGVTGLSLDYPALHSRKDQVVSSLRDGIAQSFKKNKITLYNGKATIEKPGIVTVETEEKKDILEGKHILIAVGSAPSLPPIPGADLKGVFDSDGILEQRDRLFQHLIIVGGGVIGMEFATLASDLGCQVTVIEAMERILPGMDKEISQNLKMIMKKRGVEIHTDSRVKSITKSEKGLCCAFEEKGKEETAEADGILIATGRKPLTKALFAESMKAPEMKGGYLFVDGKFQTTIPGIWAIGDVIGGIQLAHMATAQGLAAVASICGKSKTQNLQVVPACVYTSPEIACVGLTSDEAKTQGIPVKTGKYLMSVNGKSVLTMQERGFIKLVYHQDTKQILGAQLMCARATDMIGEISLAIVKNLTVEDVASVIMPHPTFCEGIAEAAFEE